MQQKHRSTIEILVYLHQHLTRLACLIQEYLILVENLSEPTMEVQQR